MTADFKRICLPGMTNCLKEIENDKKKKERGCGNKANRA